jgi:hypothetical protein
MVEFTWMFIQNNQVNSLEVIEMLHAVLQRCTVSVRLGRARADGDLMWNVSAGTARDMVYIDTSSLARVS